MTSGYSRETENKSRLLVLVVLLVFACLVWFVDSSHAHGFVSSEVHFADASNSGLAIVPASCPSYPHSPLEIWLRPGAGGACSCPSANEAPTTADGKGHILYGTTYDRRVTRYNAYFCVENEGADSYFIPAGTQAELDQFRAAAPSISDINVWGYTVYAQSYYQGSYYSEGGYDAGH